jgi:glycosyltransferase involved in cell wall biosynthesis
MPVRAITEPKISIVMPARNEARNLEVVLPELPKVHEVILVDGHSVDGTVETARRVLPEIRVVQQTRTGKGNALACGFAAVTGDIVVMFDADGSADPAEIPAFVAALVAGADVAKGTRFAAGGGSQDITRFRSLGNLGLNLMTNSLLGTRYTDLCYGYNAFWADILPALQLPDVIMPARLDGQMEWGDGFEIETVLNCRIASAGMRVTEVGSVERLRMFGRSNLNAVSDGLRVLRTIWTEMQRSHRAGITRTEIRAHSRAAAA